MNRELGDRELRQIHAAPPELVGPCGGFGYKHGAPNGACALSPVDDTCLVQRGRAHSAVVDYLAAYGRAGIAEVWIVNLNEKTIEVYREPRFTGYGSRTVLCAGDKAAPRAFPDVAVEVTEFLKR
jgi:hypothetical protein